jgi:acetylornithine deacetylase/succinyl-diaminopimelate desuccinylase-like protein
MLAALDAMRASNVTPAVNLKFFFEGEEEAGSPHLERYLSAHRDLLGADLWLICDGPVHQSGRLQLYFGARGVTGVELTTYGATRPLHSGHYGNWAPNPAVALTHLIDSMRDESGRILIDGFYDDVRPLTPAEQKALNEVPPVEEQLRDELSLGRTEGDRPLAELITRPALNVRGIRSGNVGAQASNAIPTEAAASIDFRLVPDQTPQRVQQLVEAHLRKLGWTVVHDTPDAQTLRTNARVVKVEWEAGYPSARASMDDAEVVAVQQRIERVVGQPLVKMPTLGGSVPLYLFFDLLHVRAVGLPIVNYDNDQHGANENLRLQNLWDGIAEFVAVFSK